jgi:toxin CptA
MNGAPSVSFPVGRNRLGTWMATIAWMGGALTWWAWVVLAPGPGWRQWLGLVLLMLCAGLALLESRRRLQGRLRWDGGQWCHEGPGGSEPGEVALRLDLQHWLLVRWAPLRGRAQWLWFARTDDPHHWDALRRAVYFRGRNEVPQRGQPPVA